MAADMLHFTIIDYVVFVVMLALSALIGLYFGFIAKRKQDNTAEYLMGSKSMKPFPVAVSLAATQISSVTIIAMSSEAYQYGVQLFCVAISMTILCIIFYVFFLPVFYELQGLTIYEYLERRFDRRQRMFASGIYALQAVLFMPLMVYGPALAMSQVSGINIHLATPIICLVCVFYTTFGGIRAVVWADTLQFISMIGALIFIAIYGTYRVGGLGALYERLDSGGRTVIFDANPDPTLRISIWMICLGVPIVFNLVNPECVQRFQSIGNYNDVKKCLAMTAIFNIGIRFLIIFSGALMYANYWKCDPYTLGLINKIDQLFPHYVMDISRNLPGLPGIFIAGIFAAGLSSMSTTLNSLSGCIYSDFLKRFLPNVSEKTASTIMKIIVVLIGLLNIILCFAVEHLGNLLTISFTITGFTSGPIFGSFVLGFGFPKANRHGVFWGSLASIVSLMIITIGAQYYTLKGKLKYETLPFSTEQCEEFGFTNYTSYPGFVGNPNSTIHVYNKNEFDDDSVPVIFHLGFLYYGLLGTVIVLIVGNLVSKMTGGCDNLDERLLTPMVRKRYREKLMKQKENEGNCLNNLATVSMMKNINED